LRHLEATLMTTHSGDLVHVHLRVRNVAASRAWYLKTLEPLGFRAVDGPLGSVALGVDVARIWLVPAEQGPVGGALVAIGTAQEGLVDQIGLAAGSHGHMRLTPPRNISVFVNDPDGNTLEVQSGLTAQALAVRSLTTQIPGVLWPAPGNPQRLMTRDRLLVEVTDSAPAIVTSLGGQQARDSELRVEINTTADLEALGL
jgi:catechol 2,3-dioxygenase-like lactoylglutathione lyase family enzyme